MALHTSPEVSMEYELSNFADDSRFDQVSHETDHEAEVYSSIIVSVEPVIAVLVSAGLFLLLVTKHGSLMIPQSSTTVVTTPIVKQQEGYLK